MEPLITVGAKHLGGVERSFLPYYMGLYHGYIRGESGR